MPNITELSALSRKYCEKYPPTKHQDRTLSRLILEENRALVASELKGFTRDKAIDRIRDFVRYWRGHRGEHNRKKAPENKLIAPMGYGFTGKNTIKIKESEHYLEAKKRKLKKSKYYIVTSAQNNSKMNMPFWDNIKAYAAFLGAEIHVILNRYVNPTFTTNSTEDKWDMEVMPYADAKRQHVHKYLELMSDIKIQPTAVNPLSGMEGISGTSSCIFGHPKVHLKVIPALEGYEPKMMFTTGSVTKQNYSDSKAGKKGQFHHTFGFVIVEIKDSETFFIRQVTASADGSFTDLIHHVKDKKVSVIKEIAYFNVGDKHVGVHCPKVEAKQEELLNYFKPKHTIVHDIFNGTSVNHHEEKDPIRKYTLQLTGDNLIKREFENLFKWVDKWLKYNLVVISSNHNDWIDKYIKSMDWKRDIPNAVEYMKFAQILLSGKAKHGLVAYLLKERYKNTIRTIGRNDSFRINGIELSQHGDIGSNGSRGSLMSFNRLSTKIDVMHSHTPARMDGVLYGGTSTILRQQYMAGASSHKNADIICHLDGKRQHIIYMGKSKEFTTFRLK